MALRQKIDKTLGNILIIIMGVITLLEMVTLSRVKLSLRKDAKARQVIHLAVAMKSAGDSHDIMRTVSSTQVTSKFSLTS